MKSHLQRMRADLADWFNDQKYKMADNHKQDK